MAIRFFRHRDMPGIRFGCERNSAKMIGTVFQPGVYRRSMKKSRFSTNISLYLGNDTRQDHS